MGIIINDMDKCECGAYWQTTGFCCNGHPKPAEDTKPKIDWKRWFALWKFRLDNAVSFLVFANFLLLSITASTPITEFLSSRMNINVEMYSIVGFLVVGIIFCAFLFGFVLDKVMRYTQHTMTIQNERNPQMSELLENTREILRRSK